MNRESFYIYLCLPSFSSSMFYNFVYKSFTSLVKCVLKHIFCCDNCKWNCFPNYLFRYHIYASVYDIYFLFLTYFTLYNRLIRTDSNAFLFMAEYGTPLQYFCLENPMDGEAWWAAVHGVARVGHD